MTSKTPSAVKLAISPFLLSLCFALLQSAIAQTTPFAENSWDSFEGGAAAVCDDDDIDNDNDRLIELCHLEDLNAMRHQLDGTGYKESEQAAKITTGCPNDGCRGYELVRNLDFQNDASYDNTENKTTWTRGVGWPTIAGSFSAILEGNGHTISNLKMSNETSNENVGFFNQVSNSIQNFALTNIDIEVRRPLRTLNGGVLFRSLLGSGRIINCYLQGRLETKSSQNPNGIIALLGADNLGGRISNSYVDMITSGYTLNASFLDHNNFGTISDSYVRGEIEVSNASAGFSLIRNNNEFASLKNTLQRLITPSGNNSNRDNNPVAGSNRGTISNSYWDEDHWKGETSDDNAIGFDAGGTVSNSKGFSTIELQTPTSAGATSTAPYYNWSEDNWDFGTTIQYPALLYARGDDNNNPACRNPQLPQSSQQPECATLLAGQRPNSTPTIVINSLPTGDGISLMQGTSRTWVVTVADDNDDLANLIASVESSHPRFAVATIDSSGGANRNLKITTLCPGTTTITVTVDDSSREANSRNSQTFIVRVTASELVPACSIRVRPKVFLEGPLR